MKYFTPTLFKQCNSTEFESAYQASMQWESAVKKYAASLVKWIDSAPPGVRKLATKFCGHDAELVSQNRVRSSLFSLLLVSDSMHWVLNYQILSEPVTTPPRDQASYWSDRGNRCWLYDELSQISAGCYRHEILMSDGSILQIDFSNVRIKSVTVSKEASHHKTYDLKIAYTVTTDDLKAAFHDASLTPRRTSTASSRQKPAKKTASTKSSVKPATK